MSERRDNECQDGFGDDVAAYALGALPEPEAERLEAHLTGCEACSEQLRWLYPAVDVMPMSVPQLAAPEGLKRRLMEVVEEEAAAASREEARARRQASGSRSWWRGLTSFRPALAGLAALAAVAVVAAGLLVFGGEDSLDGSYAANPVKATSSASGTVRVADGTASIEVKGLPPTSKATTYQVWIGHDGQVSPSSTFEMPDQGTGGAEIPEVPAGTDQILITREPAGGSETPRGPQVLSADLS